MSNLVSKDHGGSYDRDHAKEWKLVTDSEYKSLVENEMWELVELPSGRNQLDISGYSRSAMRMNHNISN